MSLLQNLDFFRTRDVLDHEWNGMNAVLTVVGGSFRAREKRIELSLAGPEGPAYKLAPSIYGQPP